MKLHQIKYKVYFITFASFVMISQSVMSEPIWHCSRSGVQIADNSDDFILATLDQTREVIRLSLHDLHAVYQGSVVKMSGGLTLSACRVGESSNKQSTVALESIGAQRSVFTRLSQYPAQAQSQIYIVSSDASMLACIAKHHPAVGYLSQITHTESVGPCF